MLPSPDRLSIHAAPLVGLLFLFAGGFFDGWFSSSVNEVDPVAVEQALQSTLANTDSTGRVLVGGHRLELDPTVARLYSARESAPLWTTTEDQQLLIDALSDAPTHVI